MPRVKRTIYIQAPASLIWRSITEPDKLLVWSPNFKEFKIVVDKKDKIGSIFYIVEEIRGISRKFDCIVIEWIKDKKFVYKGTSKEVSKLEGIYTIEPTDAGCRLTLEEKLQLKGGIKGKIIGILFVKRLMINDIEERLQNLKKYIVANLSENP